MHLVRHFGDKWSATEPILNEINSKVVNFRTENQKLALKLNTVMKNIETDISIAK